MRDSFVLYTSYIDQIDLLSNEQKGILLTAIYSHVMETDLPEMDGMTKMAFSFIKSQLDKDLKKYEDVCRKRKEAGKSGGRPKANGLCDNQNKAKKANGFFENQTKAKKPDNEYEYDNDIKENPLKGVKEKHFVPPTLENVIGYCQEKGLSLDAGRFIDFYESKGWMVGKNKMKDWKAAARNWARQDTEKPKKTSFRNFTERHNDYDALQKKLITDGINNGGMQ